jgi:hypothetical protein
VTEIFGAQHTVVDAGPADSEPSLDSRGQLKRLPQSGQTINLIHITNASLVRHEGSLL